MHKRLFKKSAIIKYEKIYKLPSLVHLIHRLSINKTMKKIDIISTARKVIYLYKVIDIRKLLSQLILSFNNGKLGTG